MTKKHKKNKHKKLIIGTVAIIIILVGFKLYYGERPESVKAEKNVEKIKSDNKVISDSKPSTNNSNTSVSEVDKTSEKEGTNKEVSNPQTDIKIDKPFFNTSLFIGDSVTKGIDDYDLLDSASVLASNGQNVWETEKSITGKIKTLKPEKIFILLGANDLLTGMSSSKYVEWYQNLLSMVRSEAPNAKIYIQSIFPVEAFVEKEKPLMINSRIDEFNKALKDMKKDNNMEYLNVASVFKNKNGCMQDGYTSEGIHIKVNYYNIWLDYLKNNTK